MNAPLYTIDVLRLAASLPEPRPLHADGTARERSPTCGSSIETAVTLDGEGRVLAISQAVQACAFGQAAAALVARHGAGRSLGEVEAARDGLAAWLSGADELPAWPGVAAMAPARSRRSRHGAVLLPFQALSAAIRAALE